MPSKKPPAAQQRASSVEPQNRQTVTYNKDQWISSFEDAMVKLRPHMTMRILTTIGLLAWSQKGTKGVDPALAALEWSQSIDQSK